MACSEVMALYIYFLLTCFVSKVAAHYRQTFTDSVHARSNASHLPGGVHFCYPRQLAITSYLLFHASFRRIFFIKKNKRASGESNLLLPQKACIYKLVFIIYASFRRTLLEILKEHVKMKSHKGKRTM